MNEDIRKEGKKIHRIQYIDLEELEYDYDVLLFLRKKLDPFTIDCFRMVVKKHTSDGLTKTQIENYNSHRKRFDAAFLILEGQGFIEKRSVGVHKPYFVTVRGLQLASLLRDEKREQQNNQNIEGL